MSGDNKRRDSQDPEYGTQPSSKIPKNNSNPNDQQEDVKGMWIYSNASMKRNKIIESNHSSFMKPQRLLRGILSPSPQIRNGPSISDLNDDSDNHNTKNEVRSDNDQDNDDVRNSTEDFIESTDDATKPVNDSLHGIIKQLTREIVNYELKISSLYGKVKEMTTENEKIRNRYTLMCRGVVGGVNSFNSFDQSADTEELSSDDETCASDGTESNEEDEMKEADDQIGRFRIVAPSEKLSIIRDDLESLENRILERLHNLKEDQKFPSKASPSDLERLGINLEEIPLIKDLRANMNRVTNELKDVRKFAEIRVANLKGAIISEKRLAEKAQKDVEKSKDYVRRATDFVQQATPKMEHLKVVNGSQRNVIESLKRQLISAQERFENNAKFVNDQNSVSEDYYPIFERHNRVFTAYTMLSTVSHMQKSDLTILHRLYEEERTKSISLTQVIEQQRKFLNPTRYFGQITVSDALTRLSVQYDNLCNECTREERVNRAKITSIHQMYTNLLKEKDREYQAVIESLVGELNDVKGINSNTVPPKLDPSNPTDPYPKEDIDRIIEYEEQIDEQACSN